MAQLKDLLVNGATRLIGKLTTQEAQILTLDAPEASGSSTFGPGTNGLVLKTTGSSLYWGSDNDHITTATTTGSGNAVTAVSADANGALTVTKGSTFLTSHLTIKQDGIIGATINRYGECDDTAATVNKVVLSITGGTLSLEKGVTVYIKFTNNNTAASPTLNVAGTGAVAIARYGSTAPGTAAYSSWNAGAIIAFTYDGTRWVMHDWNNTVYSTISVANITNTSGTSSGLITGSRFNSALQSYKATEAPLPTGTAAVGTSTKWAKEDHVHPIMVGATSLLNGNSGGVPTPPSDGYNLRYLRADGSWEYPSMKYISYLDSATPLSLTSKDANSFVVMSAMGTIILPDDNDTFPIGTRLIIYTSPGSHAKLQFRNGQNSTIIIPGERTGVTTLTIPGRQYAEFLKGNGHFILISGSIPQAMGNLAKEISSNYILDYREFNNLILGYSADSTITLTIAKVPSGYPLSGYKYTIIRNGTNDVKIVPAANVLIRSTKLSSNTTGGKISENKGIVTLYGFNLGGETDYWYAEGDLTNI